MDKQNYYGEQAYNNQQLPWQKGNEQTPPKLSLERTLGNSQGEVPQELFFQLPPKEMRKLEHKVMPAWMSDERYGAVNQCCLKPASLAKSTNAFLLMEQIGWFGMIFFGFIGFGSTIAIGFVTGFREFLDDLLFFFYIALVPFFIFVTGRVLREIYPLQHGIGSPWGLNRQTGLVSIYTYNEEQPEQEPKVQSVPFYEMQPYIVNSADRYGFKHMLTLRHKYSTFAVQVGDLIGDTSLIDHCDDLWDFIQDYMDISKPLPDIPLLEKYRSQDPVTAEYDKQTGRNPRYWIDMTNEEWKKHKDLYLYPRKARIEQRKQLLANSQPL